MRIMAVDLGDQRTGVAVSDATNSIAGDTFVIAHWQPEHVAEKIADLRGIPLAEVEERTTENFFRLFSKATRSPLQ